MPLGNTSIVRFLVFPYILTYKLVSRSSEAVGAFLDNESVHLFFFTILILGMTAQVSKREEACRA